MTRAEGRLQVDADWLLCAACHRPVYGKRFVRNLRVCPECGAHLPVTAECRLAQLADGGVYEVLPSAATATDPLDFVDIQSYATRLARARASTGMPEAVLCARATIEGIPVILAVMDFRFMGGSLGAAVGELITQAGETALRDRTSFVIVTSSGGARMQEGALSLM
jgi:acetyl-CoA carboxylase carboxyl transferase subunit beta